jgi:hypothetical protein
MRIGIFRGLVLAALLGATATLPAVLSCGGEDAPPCADCATGGKEAGVPVKEGCDPAAPFGPPKLMDDINTKNFEFDARFTQNELAVLVSTARSDPTVGFIDFRTYIATRASRGEKFGGLRNLVLPSGATRASMTDDQNTVLYQRRVVGAKSEDIYVAQRGDGGLFEEQKKLGINTDNFEGDPFVAPTGERVYFTARPGDNFDLFMASVPDGGTANFAARTAAPFTNVNTTDNETGPVLTGDELTIFYGQSATTEGAVRHVWMAKRPTKDEAFAAGAEVTELSTPNGESPTWVSPDGCRIYLSSNHEGDAGSADIYVAERP